MKSVIFTLITLAGLSASASPLQAQDNVYPVRLVTQSGALLPVSVDGITGHLAAHSPAELVYLALDPSTPSGDYYVHVTDLPNGNADRVLSTNAPLDRFVTVTNLGGGVIDLSVPNNPGLAMGVGLNGLGESLPLGLLEENLEHHCLSKVWIGDTFNLPVNPSWPYTVLAGGVRSYAYFRIGDGNGSSIAGVVFDDLDSDGLQDPGEPGLGGVTVDLDGPSGPFADVTEADGAYSFTGLARGTYTVSQVVAADAVATTPVAQDFDVMGCGAAENVDFGQHHECMNCEAEDVCFWRSCTGLALVRAHCLLGELPSLNVVTLGGQRFWTNNTWCFSLWMLGWSSWNMAHLLSQQVVAMHFNVELGFVDEDCMVNDPVFGQITIRALLDLAIASLGSDPYTVWCHPKRLYQTQLKTALQLANDNQTWL